MLTTQHHEFFQDSVRVKFTCYTLLCRKLVDRLPELKAAVIKGDEYQLDLDECLSFFDTALSRVLPKIDERWSVNDAIQTLAGIVRSWSSTYKIDHKEVLSVIDDILNDAAAVADEWDYQEDIDRLHGVGRELAQKFFTRIAYPGVNPIATNKQAVVAYVYDDTGKDVDGLGERPFGYVASPVAYRDSFSRWGQSFTDVIVVRYVDKMNVMLYLSYPFMFLHEYTAHILANDYRHVRFNDGWMLRAADHFLVNEEKRCNRRRTPLGLAREQVHIFGRLRDTLNKPPQIGCAIADDIIGLLTGKDDPLNFHSITHDLCAFQPEAEQTDQWPDELLTKFHLYTDRLDELYDKFMNCADLNSLYSGL